ncbi:MAG TPA: von Willebrand factor type A domain-containing protein [Clostridia bacterium]|nr:von Willebrand factor type A domain-containing protein [Clostridia bacterium]
MRNTQTFLHKLSALLMALLMALSLALPALGAPFTQELRPGDSGEEVLAMQMRLKELGYYTGQPDGNFDEATRAALILFQQDNNLLATGTLDSDTHQALYARDARRFTPIADESWAMEIPYGTLAYDTGAPGMGWSPMNTNEYDVFNENRFLAVATSPLSTFAADVDTASYAQLRAKDLRGQAVPPDSVRIEEMLNYFKYNYKQPAPGEPFGVTMELAKTPWNEDTWLLLIGLQAEEIKREERPPQNLVFLIDVSGSMDMPDKLPLVKRAFLMLLEELSPTDTVSIVTYASRDEVVLSGRPAADKVAIMEAINALEAGGSTAGAAGIITAYELAREHFIEGGNNRVLLATDGDLNVGVTDEGSLARLVEEKKQGGVFLSVLGFGDGNYKDNKLEALADRGNGNYSYIDTIHEARRALVTEIGATFFTVARDVKLQVDFNPAHLKGYRLIGYENRVMAAEDFADDTKDGGELGSGHRLTVLYELVPADSAFDVGEVISKYQQAAPLDSPALSDELLTLSVRAKAPTGEESALYTYPLKTQAPGEMTDNLRFAAAVAEVGMLLRDSEWKGSATYDSALELLRADSSLTGDPYKEEFLYLVNLLSRGN